jgi:hypothetical protein
VRLVVGVPAAEILVRDLELAAKISGFHLIVEASAIEQAAVGRVFGRDTRTVEGAYARKGVIVCRERETNAERGLWKLLEGISQRSGGA